MTTAPTSSAAGQPQTGKPPRTRRIRRFFTSRGWPYWTCVTSMAVCGTAYSKIFVAGACFNVTLGNLALAAGLALTALFFIIAPPTVMALVLEAIRDKPDEASRTPEREP